MTVSHRWHSRPDLELTRLSLVWMAGSFDIALLPELFQDAICVAKTIGISYVWIDALCIVQDDDADKLREISMMGHIYRNAMFNVGGTTAADNLADSESTGMQSTELSSFTSDMRMDDFPTNGSSSTSIVLSIGLFSNRERRMLSPFAVRFKRRNTKQRLYAVPSKLGTELDESALLKRGWVLQARLLSRRSVYLDKPIYWECSEYIACESFPGGLPLPGGGELGQSRPFRISQEERDAVHHPNYDYNKEIQGHFQYLTWTEAVEQYSKCKLTDASDLFPVLSGLARYFQTVLQDDYCAGIWRNDMLRGLLWRHNIYAFQLNEAKVYPADYRGIDNTPRQIRLLALGDKPKFVYSHCGYSRSKLDNA
ncbi:HET-domain-containing protein [Plenodomus tracheiphilus IPT5]|uniref:HET-domain-containing protein n=1 Tax=Plenodomus tracheiphilus IPT5 TaxID=1408161 RepID=A0A6A7BE00_9PLEO|nr:HET-domain-containing protein [Plenodomus tracheiphilus IPT5]